MKKSSLAILDVETTGLSPRHNELIELHILRLPKRGKTREFSSLINPGTRLPSFITGLTGITNEMVRDAPDIAEVITKAAAFLKRDDIVVGHNVSFDYAFLDHNFMQVLGQPLEKERLCTLCLARRVYPGLFSYKLQNLCEKLKIRSDGFHRAKADVGYTKTLLEMMHAVLDKADMGDMKTMLKFQKMPIKTARKRLSKE